LRAPLCFEMQVEIRRQVLASALDRKLKYRRMMIASSARGAFHFGRCFCKLKTCLFIKEQFLILIFEAAET
jgi:hypothetical protein